MYVNLDVKIEKKSESSYILTSPTIPELVIKDISKAALYMQVPSRVKELYWNKHKKIISGVKISKVIEV